MFNQDFFPTPEDVIEIMLHGYDVAGKVILEPEGGKGDIVDYLTLNGAKEVLSCETDAELRKILKTKAKIIGEDFLQLPSDRISHIDMIVGNPPFSRAAEHILHAFDIAPPGCEIIMLCNLSTITNPHTRIREQLVSLVSEHGSYTDLGDCFRQAERTTAVQVALVKLKKPGSSYSTEFDGFFMDEEPEEAGEYGIMGYNFVRDIVNRYVGAVKIFDEQLAIGQRMRDMTGTFFKTTMGFEMTVKGAPIARNDFKKDLQRSGWEYIFRQMNMEKHTTRGLREDINKFIESQKEIPFTMRNIYKMLEIVIGTTQSRMDKALEEMFDRLIKHHDDNKYAQPGWKTNSHYLLTRKFIVPYMAEQDKWGRGRKSNTIDNAYGTYFEMMEDFVKALCYITGDNYDMIGSLSNHIRYPYKVINHTDKKVAFFGQSIHYGGANHALETLQKQGKHGEIVFTPCPVYGQEFTWSYFKCRAFKKGTMHFQFLDAELWGKFNQRIAKIKGYPLFESNKRDETKKKEKMQRETGRTTGQQVLFTVKL